MSRLALKITGIHPHVGDGTCVLTFEDPRIGPITVGRDFLARHEPEVGGYYVIDDGGRASFDLTLPDNVPAPEPAAPPRRLVHPHDYFNYDWLQQWLEVFHAQGEAQIAALDALRADVADLKAVQGVRHE